MADIITRYYFLSKIMEKPNEKVTLVIKDKKFECSKECLIAASDYFRAMFSNHFVESKQDMIVLQDVEPENMKDLLEYINTGSYRIFNNVFTCLSLLQAAAMLQFTEVQEICEEMIVKRVTPTNCIDIYESSCSARVDSIANAALSVALWKFHDVVNSSSFVHLSFDSIQNYLSNSGLNIGPSGEWTVWEAIVKWIEVDECKRKEFLPKLLHVLDYSKLSEDDISNLMFFDLVNSNEDAILFLNEIKRQKKLKNDLSTSNFLCDINPIAEIELDNYKTLEIFGSEILSKTERQIPLSPCVVGYSCPNLNNVATKASLFPVIYSFNKHRQSVEVILTLTKICEGPINCSGYQVCSIGPSIYIMGGEYLLGYSNWNKTVWSYNTITRSWNTHSPLLQPRRHHMCCVLGSTIYILGGFGKHRIILHSVDAYDVITGEWTSCQGMPCTGVGAICTFKNRILLFLNCCLYTFYPQRNAWTTTELTSDYKQGFQSAVAYEESVYLTGNFCKTVFKISPDVDNQVNIYGAFINPTINVCLINSVLYNFTHENGDPKGRPLIETMNVGECQGRILETGGKTLIEKSSDKEIMLNGQRNNFGISNEIWRDKSNKHLFLSNRSSNQYSFGCFPLFKL